MQNTKETQLIKDLMTKAGTDTSGKWMSVDNTEKFVELIIAECATVISEWKHEPFPFDEDVSIRLIKGHFGIKP